MTFFSRKMKLKKETENQESKSRENASNLNGLPPLPLDVDAIVTEENLNISQKPDENSRNSVIRYMSIHFLLRVQQAQWSRDTDKCPSVDALTRFNHLDFAHRRP